MFLINFNQWKCACVGINNWVNNMYINIGVNNGSEKLWTKKHCDFTFQCCQVYDLLNFTVIFSVLYANTTNSVLHFTYSLHLLQLEVERCKTKRKIGDTCCNNLVVAYSYISQSEAASSARYLVRKGSQDES